MIEPSNATLRPRPTRELIWPEVEAPKQRLDPKHERRHYFRYARQRISGALSVDGAEYPIACTDIGYGGMQVLASDAIALRTGARVAVMIRQGLYTFRDAFSVRHTEPHADGRAIHLAL